MILGTYDKQPGEKLDYDIDFSDWIPSGDTIVSAIVSVEIQPDALLVADTPATIQPGGKAVKVWIQAGTSGKTYQVNVVATTAGGRIKEVEFRVRVKEV
jgi:hypothetical protein